MSVSDNGYPTPNVAQATLLVGVTRDTSAPVFTNNARYSDTVPENVAVASSLLTVQATRSNLVVSRDRLWPPGFSPCWWCVENVPPGLSPCWW